MLGGNAVLAKILALAQFTQGVAHRLGHQRAAQFINKTGEKGLLQQLFHLWQAALVCLSRGIRGAGGEGGYVRRSWHGMTRAVRGSDMHAALPEEGRFNAACLLLSTIHELIKKANG
ncbi:hypothetical protein Ri1_17110 [Aeromonas dhakensis]|nr:hypothetical protein Ri1_17110 [Aeromonas dhakensis]